MRAQLFFYFDLFFSFDELDDLVYVYDHDLRTPCYDYDWRDEIMPRRIGWQFILSIVLV